jgi:hypothetical protein
MALALTFSFHDSLFLIKRLIVILFSFNKPAANIPEIRIYDDVPFSISTKPYQQAPKNMNNFPYVQAAKKPASIEAGLCSLF